MSASALATKAIGQGVTEFSGANNEADEDLAAFGVAVGLSNLTIDRHAGPPNNPGAEITEASLDIQCVLPHTTAPLKSCTTAVDFVFEP